MSQYGFEAQLRIYTQSLTGKSKWDWPVGVSDWREAARAKLADGPWGYLEGGAGLETTMDANREAFTRYAIRSRMLHNVEDRNLAVQLLNHTVPVPFLLAPIGVQSILHDEAELGAAKAAAHANVPFILSTVSSVPMETIAQAMGDAIRWFQLYPGRDPEIIRSFLQRAERSGYSAVVVTVDTTMLGWRLQDLNNIYLPFLFGEGIANFMTDPAFRARLTKSTEEDPQRAVQEFLSVYVNPAFSWEGLAQVREMTNLPILVKGITHPEDAARVEAMGLDGVIVSNHGGRQVDGGVAALDALVDIRKVVAPDYLVLMDSGIRCAADVYKAIALGAHAVLVGRPYAYALSVGGEAGVAEMLNQWKAELDLQLALSGYAAVSEINSDYVRLRG